jgi:non-specific serine/threonine protein kinase
MGAAYLSFFQDDHPRARSLCIETIRLGRAVNNHDTVALALCRLGFVERQLGDLSEAVRLTDEGLTLSRRHGGKQTIAHCLDERGHVAIGEGDYDHAEVCFVECLQLARESGHELLESYALLNLGSVMSLRGKLDRAIDLCGTALALFRRRRDRYGELTCTQWMMHIAHLCSDDERVAILARQVLVTSQEIGRPAGAANALSRLAWVARVRNDPTRSCRLLAAAQALMEARGRHASSVDRDVHEAEVALLRASLGEEGFKAAWAEGEAMTLEQAVAYALGEADSS